MPPKRLFAVYIWSFALLISSVSIYLWEGDVSMCVLHWSDNDKNNNKQNSKSRRLSAINIRRWHSCQRNNKKEADPETQSNHFFRFLHFAITYFDNFYFCLVAHKRTFLISLIYEKVARICTDKTNINFFCGIMLLLFFFVHYSHCCALGALRLTTIKSLPSPNLLDSI